MSVLLANGHTQVRWALRTVLKEEPDLTVIGEVSDSKDLLAQAQILRPELILLEWELLGPAAGRLLAALCDLDVPTKVIVLSRQPECEGAALAAGADAFVSKANGDGPGQFLALLHRLVES